MATWKELLERNPEVKQFVSQHGLEAWLKHAEIGDFQRWCEINEISEAPLGKEAVKEKESKFRSRRRSDS